MKLFFVKIIGNHVLIMKNIFQAYRTGVFGRSQVVHYAMNLLVSWVFSNEGNEDALFSSVGLLRWLRNLLLDDHDPSVRREACTGLYKLCLGTTLSGARTGSSCTAPLLSVLLEWVCLHFSEAAVCLLFFLLYWLFYSICLHCLFTFTQVPGWCPSHDSDS